MRRGIAARLRRARRFLPAAVLAAAGWDCLVQRSRGSARRVPRRQPDRRMGPLDGRGVPGAPRPRAGRAWPADPRCSTPAAAATRWPRASRAFPACCRSAPTSSWSRSASTTRCAGRASRRPSATCGGSWPTARAAGARVLLVGRPAPPSLATAHARRFAAIYPRVAADVRVALVPDLLAGAAGDPSRMFPDALHPNARGSGSSPRTCGRRSSSSWPRSSAARSAGAPGTCDGRDAPASGRSRTRRQRDARVPRHGVRAARAGQSPQRVGVVVRRPLGLAIDGSR